MTMTEQCSEWITKDHQSITYTTSHWGVTVLVWLGKVRAGYKHGSNNRHKINVMNDGIKVMERFQNFFQLYLKDLMKKHTFFDW